MTDGCDISSDIAVRWTSLDLSDNQSTLVQVMAWCRQAPSHYLNQCWPRSLPPYSITWPQWEKLLFFSPLGIDLILNHFHIWHVLMQLSCSDTSQIWTRYLIGNSNWCLRILQIPENNGTQSVGWVTPPLVILSALMIWNIVARTSVIQILEVMQYLRQIFDHFD